MAPTPVVGRTSYATCHEHRGTLEVVNYVTETELFWDDKTTLTIRRETPRRPDVDKAAIYEAMRESSERLGQVLASVPTMTRQIAEYQECIGTIMATLDDLHMLAFDERHGGAAAKALVAIRAAVRGMEKVKP